MIARIRSRNPSISLESVSRTFLRSMHFLTLPTMTRTISRAVAMIRTRHRRPPSIFVSKRMSAEVNKKKKRSSFAEKRTRRAKRTWKVSVGRRESVTENFAAS